jgi:hypothetical protein
MKGVELYGRVRYAVQIEGLSHREAARQFGIDPGTGRQESSRCRRVTCARSRQLSRSLIHLFLSGRRPLIKGFFAALRLIGGAVMSSAC